MRIDTDRRIEDILADQGQISPAVASRLKVEAINAGKSVEDLLISQKLVTSEIFIKAKAEFLNIPYTDLNNVAVTTEVLTLVPEELARRYQIFPFDLDNKTETISLAMADPLDLQVLAFIERKTALKIKPYISTPEKILKAVREQYAQNLTTEVNQALEETNRVVEADSLIENLDKTEEMITEAPVAKIVSTLVEYALKSRASDIHIEPLEDKTRIRYRIDGILQERLFLPKKVHEQVTSRIKILSDMKIDEKRLPQDGRFTYKLNETVLDLRVSSLPTVFGEKIVMRLLPKSGVVPSLSELGLRGNGLKSLNQEILRPHGIILLVGPTGSGKTTSLFALLSRISTPKVNIITVEDPVEYQIPGVNQVQVNNQAGLTFASGLRSILRQDPNIIMVGEIRDRETADLAVQASLTGHLVFSTLHTNNAAGTLPRLLDMGVESFLLASSINCVVAQRVVRLICPSCKQSYEPSEVLFADIQKNLGELLKCSARDCQVANTDEGKPVENHVHKILLYRGKGCRECGDSGYRGRVGIFEVLVVDERVSRLIIEKKSDMEIQSLAVKNGMITLLQDGYLKALEGLTTIEEVLRVAHD